MPDTAYAPPSAPLQRADPISDAELRAFVGEGADYYLSKWAKLREGSSSLAGFNWVAALFTFPWLLYRRLWIWVPPAILLSSAISLAPALAPAEWITAAGTATLIANVCVPGLAGNVILYRRALRAIHGSLVTDPNERLAELARRGGTSEWAMWLGIVVPFLVGLISSILRLSEEVGRR